MYIAGSGQLVVIGTDGNDTCTISETTVSGIPQIKVTMNRKSVNFARHLVTADSVYFLGGEGK